MAGSYEHIRRATKPTDNTAESYGGLNTSFVENMGDAIEAMVHMWWMIQILANGNKALIKNVSHQAQGYETGHLPIPPGPWDVEAPDDDDEFPMKMPGVGHGPNQVPPANGPQPLPTDWTPTMYLRFVKRIVGGDPVPGAKNGEVYVKHRFILQQGYAHANGDRIWVDVPTVEE